MTKNTKSWRELFPPHPACAMFPPLQDDAMKALVADIKEHGIRHPIKLWKYLDKDGHPQDPENPDRAYVLDGANRLDAFESLCGALQLEHHDGFFIGVPFELVTVVDPYMYALSANVHRRHLTKEQQADFIVAMVVARNNAKQEDQNALAQHTTPTKEHREALALRKVHSAAAAKKPHRSTGRPKGRPRTMRSEIITEAAKLKIPEATVNRALDRAAIQFNTKSAKPKKEAAPVVELVECPCCKGAGKCEPGKADFYRQILNQAFGLNTLTNGTKGEPASESF
jgi:hypothetical protein